MPNIRHMLAIAAPLETVFKAITEREGLASWWTPETIASPGVGGILEFKFADKYHNKMRVTEFSADRCVEWECLEGDRQWIGTRFRFELEEKDGKTWLHFGQLGWKEESDFFAHCNYWWGYYMHSLKQYCETGAGTPFKPPGQEKSDASTDHT